MRIYHHHHHPITEKRQQQLHIIVIFILPSFQLWMKILYINILLLASQNIYKLERSYLPTKVLALWTHTNTITQQNVDDVWKAVLKCSCILHFYMKIIIECLETFFFFFFSSQSTTIFFIFFFHSFLPNWFDLEICKFHLLKKLSMI
mgnify:CR=1 FL=1